MMKLQGRPSNINIVRVYAPMQDHSNAEMEVFYEEIGKALKHAKSDDLLNIMGTLMQK